VLHPQGSSCRPYLSAAPSQNHASWTLSSRSLSPSLDRASSQMSSLRHLISSDVIKEAQNNLQEMFDDENEEQKRIMLPRYNAAVIMSLVACEDRTCSQPHEQIRPRLFPCGEAQGATLRRCYHKSAVCLLPWSPSTRVRERSALAPSSRRRYYYLKLTPHRTS
jgi:hypothetical protein